MSERIFVTGGTGFLGRRITAALAARGDLPVVLSRSAERARRVLGAGVEIVEGDPTAEGPWQDAVAGAAAVVHLAGEHVGARRWNAHFRQILHDSRVDSTRFVVEAMAAASATRRPRVLVSASGLDYYSLCDPGDVDADDDVTEDGPPGESFFSRVCLHWEEEAEAAVALGARVVRMRTGFVLGEGGNLERMAAPFRFYVGGPIASGEQWTSWIHIDDAVRAYLFAIDCERLVGAVNLVSPANARNRELARAIGAALHKPSWLRAPAFAVRLVGGELAEYIIRGRRAIPAALLDAGFQFQHTDLPPAVATALRGDAPKY